MEGTDLLWFDVPGEIRGAIEPLILRHRRLLPGWCHKLVVQTNRDTSRDENLSTDVLPDYRTAKLFIHPAWIEETVEVRESAVIHEFLHIPLSHQWSVMFGG